MSDFTHFNDQGRAKMVDVGEKNITRRTATAMARVFVNENTFALIQSGGMKKGDVLTVAQVSPSSVICPTTALYSVTTGSPSSMPLLAPLLMVKEWDQLEEDQSTTLQDSNS